MRTFCACAVDRGFPDRAIWSSSPAETIASWELLRGWLAGGPQPTPLAMQVTCNAFVAGRLAAGPFRINPAFVIPDMDGRVRPRYGSVISRIRHVRVRSATSSAWRLSTRARSACCR
jgi:hypothetical protein